MTRLMFIQAKSRRYFYLTLLTSLIAFAWMLLGVYLQTTGNASACPDWPSCFGFLNVPTTPSQIQLAIQRFPHTRFNAYPISLEIIHRYLFATILIGITLLTLGAIKLWKKSSIQPLLLCCCLLLLAYADVTLWLRPISQNPEPLLQFRHALIAFAIFGILWWLSRIMHPRATEIYTQPQKSMRRWTWLSLLLVLQIVISLSVNISYLDTACTHVANCTNTLTALLRLDALNSQSHMALSALLSQQTLDYVAVFGFGYLTVFGFALIPCPQINHLAYFLILLMVAKLFLVKFAVITTPVTLFMLYQTTIAAFLIMIMISLLIHFYRKPHHYWSH